MIIATLDNGVNTQDASIGFTVTIFNDCANDEIFFGQALAPEYDLFLFPGEPQLTLNPMVS